MARHKAKRRNAIRSEVTYDTAQTILTGNNGEVIRSVFIDYRNCTVEGEELIDVIIISLTNALSELHHGLSDNGVFRYELRSDNFLEGEWFPFQNPGLKRVKAEDILMRIAALLQSENTFPVFRSLVEIQLFWTPRNVVIPRNKNPIQKKKRAAVATPSQGPTKRRQ